MNSNDNAMVKVGNVLRIAGLLGILATAVIRLGGGFGLSRDQTFYITAGCIALVLVGSFFSKKS